MSVMLPVCPTHGYVGEGINVCPLCAGPITHSARAEDVKPQFAMCCLVTCVPKEDMPTGTVVRTCRDCGRDVWLSPSTQNVEARMAATLPCVCCECHRPKKGDMAFWTVDGEREVAERERRRRERG